MLAPVVAITPAVVAVMVAIAVVGFAISVLVAFAVRVLVLAVISHPVLVTAGVFPIVVLESKAAAALDVVLSGALTIAKTISVTVLAGLVTIVGMIVTVTPGLGGSHRAEGEGNGCA